MLRFDALIERFENKGEKTGWTYIEISARQAEMLFPGNKKTFRVKGKLDEYSFEGLALLPMGEGNFILPLNGEIRKKTGKGEGGVISVSMERDLKEKPLSPDLINCLEDDPVAGTFFYSLTKGHQRYFSNWIDAAKTDDTKAKRITQALNALGMGLNYAEMIRMNKKAKY